jgi:hypothetical protein
MAPALRGNVPVSGQRRDHEKRPCIGRAEAARKTSVEAKPPVVPRIAEDEDRLPASSLRALQGSADQLAADACALVIRPHR